MAAKLPTKFVTMLNVNLLICHHLLTLMSFQTGIGFFLLQNTKEDILKNVGYQTVLVPIE